jgi:ubiquitin C-terminal hydrolase
MGRPSKNSKVKGCIKSATSNLLEEKNMTEILEWYKIIPFGLKNKAQNVCFLNSVIQIFYRIDNIYDRVLNFSTYDRVVSGIKDIFEDINMSVKPIETHRHVQKLELPFYQAKQQYDCHECLTYLLNKVFPSLNSEGAFRLQTLQSISCTNIGCNFTSDRVIDSATLTLTVLDTNVTQTIRDLINNFMSRQCLHNFRCEGCQGIGFSYKTNNIFQLLDVLIIQLASFRFVSGGFSEKIIPNLLINEFSVW